MVPSGLDIKKLPNNPYKDPTQVRARVLRVGCGGCGYVSALCARLFNHCPYLRANSTCNAHTSTRLHYPKRTAELCSISLIQGGMVVAWRPGHWANWGFEVDSFEFRNGTYNQTKMQARDDPCFKVTSMVAVALACTITPIAGQAR